MSSQVALLLGYGGRVASDVSKAFAALGYQLAVVSRSKKEEDTASRYLHIQADLSDPNSVEGIFSKVINNLGHPSVVIYNAGGLTMRASSTLPQQITDFQADNNVNIVSAYVAAQLAAKSFARLPKGASNTFIYTGNKQPFLVVQPLLSIGVGKSGAAHLLHYLAEEHKTKGYSFYFADERKENGDPVYAGIDGDAHAEYYTHLAGLKTQGPWNATFVKGKGYVKFSEEPVPDMVIFPHSKQ